MMYYIKQIRRSVLTYKNASGCWKGDAKKPYISAAVNLLLNILLSRYIGINGVVISTIISLGIIEGPWEVRVLFHVFFKTDSKTYYLDRLIYLLEFVTMSAVVYLICNRFHANTITRFIIKTIIVGIITMLLFVIFNMRSKKMYRLINWMKAVKIWKR